MMYQGNRIFMYCATVWNLVTLGFNVRQVKSVSERLGVNEAAVLKITSEIGYKLYLIGSLPCVGNFVVCL